MQRLAFACIVVCVVPVLWGGHQALAVRPTTSLEAIPRKGYDDMRNSASVQQPYTPLSADSHHSEDSHSSDGSLLPDELTQQRPIVHNLRHRHLRKRRRAMTTWVQESDDVFLRGQQSKSRLQRSHSGRSLRQFDEENTWLSAMVGDPNDAASNTSLTFMNNTGLLTPVATHNDTGLNTSVAVVNSTELLAPTIIANDTMSNASFPITTDTGLAATAATMNGTGLLAATNNTMNGTGSLAATNITASGTNDTSLVMPTLTVNNTGSAAALANSTGLPGVANSTGLATSANVTELPAVTNDTGLPLSVMLLRDTGLPTAPATANDTGSNASTSGANSTWLASLPGINSTGSLSSPHHHFIGNHTGLNRSAHTANGTWLPHSYRQPVERWLLPIPLYGPNNQVTGLKEGLIMSRLLHRTAILPSIYEHDLQLDNMTVMVNGTNTSVLHHKPFPFNEIFDPASISGFTKVITMDAMRAAGWNGTLDAVLFWNPKDLLYLERLQFDNISTLGARRFQLQRWASPCLDHHAANLRARLASYKFVGVCIYKRLVYDTPRVYSNASMPGGVGACHRLSRDVSFWLRRKSFIQIAAKKFVAEKLGPGPFMAVHVRPYPDTCLSMWQMLVNISDRPTSLLERRCRTLGWNWCSSPLVKPLPASACANPVLHIMMARQTKAVLHRVRMMKANVFVVAHPAIRPLVERTFTDEGLRPVFLPSEFAYDAWRDSQYGNVTNLSTTLLVFLEQEIALRSRMFIGTWESSISKMIRQERWARGIPDNHNMWFRSIW